MATKQLEQQAEKEYKEALKRQKEAAEESQVLTTLDPIGWLGCVREVTIEM